MKIHLVSDALESLDAEVLAVQMYQHDDLARDKRFAQLDKVLKGELAKTAKAEGFTGKSDQALVVHTLGHLKPRVLLFLGVGDQRKNARDQDRHFGATAVRKATAVRAKTLALAPADHGAKD